jgi:hypothetical protein
MIFPHLRLISSLGLLVIGGSLMADPAPGAAPVTMAVQLHNGTVIKHVTLDAPIEIETRYGTFKLKPSDIRRVEFAFRVPAEDASRLAKALKDVAGDNFQEREMATQELVALGRIAYPALIKAAKSKADPETTKRVETVLEEIRKKIPVDQLKFSEEDMVQTADATLRGKITASTLTVKAKVLNELTLPLAHVSKLRSMVGSQFVTMKASGDQPWVQTDVQLQAGAAFEIKVNGILHFDLKGARLSTGPRGSMELANVINSMVAQNVVTPVGLLSGRVGNDGSSFEIGKSYQGVATAEGPLFLHIYTGGPHDFPITGSFQLEIEIN